MAELEKKDLLWAVFLKKEGSKQPRKIFILVKKMPLFENGCSHGVGFWADENSLSSMLESPGTQDLCEEWIPRDNIINIRSLMYKER